MIVDRDAFDWAHDVPRGRQPAPKGGVHTAALTPTQVQEIRELLRQGVKQMDIAARYKVSNGCISDIKHNKTWLNV